MNTKLLLNSLEIKSTYTTLATSQPTCRYCSDGRDGGRQKPRAGHHQERWGGIIVFLRFDIKPIEEKEMREGLDLRSCVLHLRKKKQGGL